jgi:hypothetical protein
LVEAVVVLPLLGLMLFVSQAVAELSLVALEVRQLARFAAVDASKRIGGRVNLADGAEDADLAPIRSSAGLRALFVVSGRAGLSPHVRRAGAPQVSVEAFARAALSERLVLDGPLDGGASAEPARRLARRPLEEILEEWGLSSTSGVVAKGRVKVLEGRLGLFDEQVFEAQLAVAADDWALRDGGDVRMDRSSTGLGDDGAPHPLHRQVARLGRSLEGAGSSADALTRGLGLPLGVVLPEPSGTYVVSHAYRAKPVEGGRRTPDCGDRAHPAPLGLNNLAETAGLDAPLPRCFDTAPFRDHTAYASSPSVQAFVARGPFGFGCQNAQASDPTRDERTQGDAFFRPCGGSTR